MIDADGTQLGIKPLSEALGLARSKSLDLIEIAPMANPPVCKLLDYSKYRYEMEKKDRESRKKQKAGLLKEVRFKPHIGAHDLDVKIRQITEFITAHDKVRITVIFRGREMQHRGPGHEAPAFDPGAAGRDRGGRAGAVAVTVIGLVMTLIPKR